MTITVLYYTVQQFTVLTFQFSGFLDCFTLRLTTLTAPPSQATPLTDDAGMELETATETGTELVLLWNGLQQILSSLLEGVCGEEAGSILSCLLGVATGGKGVVSLEEGVWQRRGMMEELMVVKVCAVLTGVVTAVSRQVLEKIVQQLEKKEVSDELNDCGASLS